MNKTKKKTAGSARLKKPEPSVYGKTPVYSQVGLKIKPKTTNPAKATLIDETIESGFTIDIEAAFRAGYQAGSNSEYAHCRGDRKNMTNVTAEWAKYYHKTFSTKQR
jgi:hypothetical protein